MSAPKDQAAMRSGEAGSFRERAKDISDQRAVLREAERVILTNRNLSSEERQRLIELLRGLSSVA